VAAKSGQFIAGETMKEPYRRENWEKIWFPFSKAGLRPEFDTFIESDQNT